MRITLFASSMLLLGFLSACQSIGTHQIGMKDWLDRYRGYPLANLIRYPEARIVRYEDTPTGRLFYLTTINEPNPKLKCDYTVITVNDRHKRNLEAWIVVDIVRTGACANWPDSR